MSFTTSDWIAVYAAALSTALFIKEIVAFILSVRSQQRQVQVNCKWGMLTSPPFNELIEIQAINVGHRPVTVTSAGFRLTDGRTLIQTGGSAVAGTWPLPKTLTDGQDVSVYFDYQPLIEELRTKGLEWQSAFVKDAEGNTYSTSMSGFAIDKD